MRYFALGWKRMHQETNMAQIKSARHRRLIVGTELFIPGMSDGFCSQYRNEAQQGTAQKTFERESGDQGKNAIAGESGEQPAAVPF
jgi:hypothetical protein